MAAKREFPHHMIKEIFEQPQGLHDTIAPRISLPEGIVQLNEVPIRREELRRAATVGVRPEALSIVAEAPRGGDALPAVAKTPRPSPAG